MSSAMLAKRGIRMVSNRRGVDVKRRAAPRCTIERDQLADCETI